MKKITLFLLTFFLIIGQAQSGDFSDPGNFTVPPNPIGSPSDTPVEVVLGPGELPEETHPQALQPPDYPQPVITTTQDRGAIKTIMNRTGKVVIIKVVDDVNPTQNTRYFTVEQGRNIRVTTTGRFISIECFTLHSTLNANAPGGNVSRDFQDNNKTKIKLEPRRQVIKIW
jgi:hypothetical protein